MQKELILDQSEATACDIIHRLCNGELTPMMLSDRKKSRSIYIYYLRYLTNKVYKENPEEAKRLAAEVRRDILFNESISDKTFCDEQYFSILLEWNKYSYVPRIKRTEHLLDAAIQRGKKKTCGVNRRSFLINSSKSHGKGESKCPSMAFIMKRIGEGHHGEKGEQKYD